MLKSLAKLQINLLASAGFSLLAVTTTLPHSFTSLHIGYSTFRAECADVEQGQDVSGLSVHHNQLWSHDDASFSIPTTTAAAEVVSSHDAPSRPNVIAASQAGSQPLLAPLPMVTQGIVPLLITLNQA